MRNPITRFAERYNILVQIITWILRFFVGGLFIFSGFTKGVDTWGTIFKFKEYFSVWGYEVWDALNVVGVFILCMIEFLTGIFLVLGCFRRAAPVTALLIMAFMLPLTLWLAVKNPIADCGCFGDAFKISNWDTFYKNVVLTIGALWLTLFNKRAMCLVSPYLQWIASVVAGLYILIIAWVGYFYQPLIDFRPYKTGSELVNLTPGEEEDDEDQYLRFVYEKNGEKKTFTIDDQLPDEEEGWKFVERIYVEPAEEEQQSEPSKTEAPVAEVKNLRLFSENGREDETEIAIHEGRQLLLMIPDLSQVSAAKTWKINSFYDWSKKNNIDMIAVVGGNPIVIKHWKDISQSQYPIYTADDTSIKEVVRGNPGIVYIEDGIIKWKSSLQAIDIDDFQDPEVSSNPMSFAIDDRKILEDLTWVFIGIMAVLVFLSVFYKIIRSFFRERKPKFIPVARKKMIPEWDNPRRILITMPGKKTDWNYILEEAHAQYKELIEALINGGEKIIMICDDSAPEETVALVKENGGTVVTDIPYNDTWTRDYGPITILKENKLRELDFGFNGWGLKFASDKDNLVNLRMAEKGYRDRKKYKNRRDFTLEGGSIESDGEGTILTTSRCLCSPERNGGKSKEEIERILRHRIGAKRVLWLDHGFLEGDDTDSHVDTLARIAPDHTIVYVAPPKDRQDVHHDELVKMESQLKEFRTADGHPYRLLPLPFPDAIYDEDGQRLPATYANYLVTTNNVYVPVYGQPENDDRACEVIQQAFPNHKLHRVNCCTLIKQHGSLHCSTMQLYY